MKFHISITFLLIILLWQGCTDPKKTDPVKNNQDTTTTSNIGAGSPLVQALTERIRNNPRDPVPYFERGDIFYQSENYPAAIQDLSQAIVLDPANFDYYHRLADAYLDNVESKKALETMYTALRIDSTRIPSLLKLSEFQMILKQYDQSMATASRVLKYDPRNSDAYYMMGLNFKEVGDTARSINSFQTSVEQDPYQIDAYRNLAVLFDKLKNPIALQYFDNALRIDSTDMDALFGKGWYYHQRNNFDEAKKLYDKAASLYPHNPDIHFNNGFLHMEMEDYETAYKKFDVAVKVEPTYAKGYFYRGLMAESLGKPQEAAEDYRLALQIIPNYNQAKQALARLGQSTE